MGATMTDNIQKVQAGLVFLGKRSFDIAAITCGIADALDRLGERVEERRCESDTQATLRAQRLVCRVRIAEGRPLPRLDIPPAHILELSLERGAGNDAQQHVRSETSAETLIAHLLAGLQAILVPDYVQWTDPRAVLTRSEFRAAVANTAAMPAPVRPAPAAVARRRKRLPDVETAYAQLRAQMPGFGRDRVEETRLDALRAAFRDPDPAEANKMAQLDDIREPTAPLRLSVWMLTLALGLFALPVAAALTVINLLRGENMRLTAQTTALTGTFMVLATHGQIAQAAQLLGVLG